MKGNKLLGFLLVLVVLLGGMLLLELGYFSKNSGYGTRGEVDSTEVMNLAKKDCFEAEASQRIKNAPPDYFIYTKSLEKKLLVSMGITPERIKGLLFVYNEVPDTDKCWLVWAIDLSGRGVVGYESLDGKMRLYNSSLPKDKLDGILKQIKIPI